MNITLQDTRQRQSKQESLPGYVGGVREIERGREREKGREKRDTDKRAQREKIIQEKHWW